MLLIDERIRADGSHAKTWMHLVGDRLAIVDDDGTAGQLSVAALDRVMTRYGRPLDTGIVADGEVLDMPGGCGLRRWRYHAPVDAIGRDYLVWERPGQEPLAVIATMATAALRYLVVRITEERAGQNAPQETETDP